MRVQQFIMIDGGIGSVFSSLYCIVDGIMVVFSRLH